MYKKGYYTDTYASVTWPHVVGMQGKGWLDGHILNIRKYKLDRIIV